MLTLEPYTASCWNAPQAGTKKLFPQIGGGATITAATTAASIVSQLAAQPAGRRVLMFAASDSSSSWIFQGFPKNSDSLCDDGIHYYPAPLISNGMVNHYRGIFQAIKNANQILDMIACDMEVSYGTFSLSWPDTFDAIEADHRASTLAGILGFSDFTAAEDTSSGFLFRHGDKMKWDNNAFAAVNTPINTRLLPLLQSFFPQAVLNNYQSSLIASTNTQADTNGYMYYSDTCFGNSQAPNCYGAAGQIYSDAGALFPQADFTIPATTLVWNINLIRAGAQVNPNVPIMPWVTRKNFAASDFGASILVLTNSPWYDENARHCLVNGSGHLLLFNSGSGSDTDLDNVLIEAAGIASNSPPVQLLTTQSLAYSTTQYPPIVSVSKLANGYVMGRVTFPGTQSSIQLSYNGQTVTVNKIPGQLGAWFTVPPQITTPKTLLTQLFNTRPPIKGTNYTVSFIDNLNANFNWQDLSIQTSANYSLLNANNDIATVTHDGKLTPIKAGTVTIRLRFSSLEIPAFVVNVTTK